MTKDERLYLENLSLKLYGTKSKYQKMMRGEKAPMEEIMADGTQRKYIGLHYQTLEEVKKMMEELSIEEDETQAKLALESKENEEAAKELEAEALKQAQAREIKRLEEKHDPVMDVLETVGD